MADILQLKKSNCKNCHRCIRSCPVKSITFAESQAKVISHECILCGKCTLVCPQNAKQVRNDLTEVFAALGQGRQVIATVAPAFVSEFGAGDLSAFSAALKRLGFAEVYETAEGAEVVRKEYEAIIAERRQEVVISTCCHTVVMLVQKYYPDAVRFLAPVVSPMIASARLIKAKHPDAYVVFIGPCISKKDERTRIPGAVDCVLTFDELRGWMEQKGVSAEFGPIEARETRVSRFFPKTGGIIQSMDTAGSGYRYLAVDGVHHCMRVIEEIRAGGLRGYFIEMSACEGSCINGPATHAYREASMVRSHMRIDEFAQPDRVTRDDFSAVAGFSLARAIPADPVCEPEHTDEAITEVLAKMGKTRPEHELNCGSCGYPTCRDKARAVLNGKADLAMCLPFLIERAESFSNSIFEISPNAIFVL
ncbi:MAG: [Fe-Fe] hydrogenase large subunit C-terminal domain-containing protein, partial [Oscillospiraceae bacterium]